MGPCYLLIGIAVLPLIISCLLVFFTENNYVRVIKINKHYTLKINLTQAYYSTFLNRK